jgi:hypothetical protein
MLLRSRRHLRITCQIGSRTNVEVSFVEANRTLSDEASNKLLLLYGRTDAALEITLVEHSEFTVISGYYNKYCK